MRFLKMLVMLFCVPAVLFAQDVSYPAKPKQSFYVDAGQMLDFASMDQVGEITQRLWKEQHIPLVVVTIPSLAAYHAENMTVKSYATALFNHWGIGSQSRNYGMLFLISKGDRKLRIELGKGWGHEHDAQVQKIIEESVVPQFKQGNFNGGIVAGVKGLGAMARGLNLPQPAPAPTVTQSTQPASPWALPLMLLAGALMIGAVFSLFRSGKSGWAWILIAALVGFIWYTLSNSGSGSNDGDGGFGGGSSGGGGGDGSW